jgi:tRNA threonylcarbamoyl adenosine modification protein YeaZ
LILSIDTSLSSLHIGLFSDSAELLAQFHHHHLPTDRGIHDAMLAEKTSELLKSIAASGSDISKIVLISGPGSFTGLRIGLSFAKGLAFGTAAQVIALKAHLVLLETYKKKHGLIDKIAIVYPGYEPDKYYISFSKAPEDIEYLTIAELEEQAYDMIICPLELDRILLPLTIVPISLEVMAEMGASRDGESIADLEPFYGTDFKTGK